MTSQRVRRRSAKRTHAAATWSRSSTPRAGTPIPTPALYPTTAALHRAWTDPDGRAEVIARPEERGIDFVALASAAGQPDADPLDLLCHLAYNAPLASHRPGSD